MVIILISVVFFIKTEILIYNGEFKDLINNCKDYINIKFKENKTFNIVKNLKNKFMNNEINVEEKELINIIKSYKTDKNYCYQKSQANPKIKNEIKKKKLKSPTQL